MPVNNWDSSLLTARKNNKFISNTFLNRIQPTLPNNPVNNSTGYGNAQNGNFNNSVINSIKLGQGPYYRNNCLIDEGCIRPVENVIEPIVPPGPVYNDSWFSQLGNDVTITDSTILGDSIYIVGRFGGTATFNSANLFSEGSPSMSLTTLGNLSDTFVAKYSKTGILEWVTRIGSAGQNSFGGYITNDGISIYVAVNGGNETNIFSATPSFGIPSSPSMLISSTRDENTYLAKYDINGQLIWGTKIQNAYVGGLEYYYNNLYLSLTNRGDSFIVDPIVIDFFNADGLQSPIFSESITIGATPQYSNGFVAQYNLNGTVQWASFEMLNASEMNLVVNSTGIYIAGVKGNNSFYFLKKIDLNGGDLWDSAIQSSNSPDNGTILYLNNSKLICASVTYPDEAPEFVDIYDSSGNGFTTVSTVNTNNLYNSLITIYDTNGILTLLTKIQSFTNVFTRSIVYDTDIYISGRFMGQTDFYNANGIVDPTVIAMSLTSNLSADIFLAKYNSSGQLQWATKIDTPGFDQSGPLLVDGDYIYLCGNLAIDDPKIIYSANGLNAPILSVSIPTGTSPAFILQYTIDGTIVT